MKLSRRALVAGGLTAVAAGAALEYLSLRGTFDFRRHHKTDPSKYRASLVSVADEPAVIHVGHSTHLISLKGTRILTDPWFYDPAFGAMTHDRPSAVMPSELSGIDAVAISHDHADHFDRRAVRELERQVVMIVATEAMQDELRAMGFKDVRVLRPGAATDVGPVKVTAVLGKHDIYEVGFVFEERDHRIYFAGDTALFDGLDAIAALKPTLAILPVDGTRLIGGDLWVMTPEDAVLAAQRLGVKAVMPSHAEAYFSDVLVDCCIARMVPDAPTRFAQLMAERLPDVRCEVPNPGDWVQVPAV